MRDQPPLRADDIGVAVLAHLDLRNHVPDQLEIDFGDADARVTTRARDGQRHIGLRFPAEVDRPVVDLVRHGFGEFRVVRIVGAAADHVHGQPRNAQALLAGGIELRQLGDGRDLAQQPQGIEPALLDRAGRPRQLRRPPKLAFDFPDELADLGGRSLGLFALNAHQRSLVFLIIEPHVENAVGQQRKRDHRREQHDIFAEQAVADFGGRHRSRTGRGSGVPRAPVRLRRQIV
jgi:hypothetical protein